MPSPFPGMNPYFERVAVWESFHQNFITTAQFEIAGQLGSDYIVRTETRLYIHEPPSEERFRGKADVGVAHPPADAHVASASIATAPAYVTLMEIVDIERIGYIAIRVVAYHCVDRA